MCVQPSTAAVNVTLLAFAAERRDAAPAAVDRSAARRVPSRKPAWRHQKEEVGWALASVRQPNAEGVRSEAPRGRGAADAETSAEGARVEGIPLPIRLRGLGERRKLPQRGLGRSPSRNRFRCTLPLKSDLWCQKFP